MFSKACQYAIRSLIFITIKSKEGKRVNVSAVSKQIDGPVAFTAKILQKLAKAQIVTSLRGPNGGFIITPDKASKTNLASIVHIIDGSYSYKNCIMGLPECSYEKPCPIHSEFNNARIQLQKLLENTTIESLTFGFEDGTINLRM